MKYRHIFFDLDRTLYDFDTSTRQTFLELFEKFSLFKNGVNDFDEFLKIYHENNLELWAQYRVGKIKKKFLNVERFHITLLHYGINDRAFAGRFASDYLHESPKKKTLFPGVLDAVKYLHSRYKLHIITNGFDEVQQVKMEANGLNDYFITVTTSEEAGAKKPSERIFIHALVKSGAAADESLMIGDDYDVDIEGARNVGMDQMLFIPNRSDRSYDCTYVIHSFEEIMNIL